MYKERIVGTSLMRGEVISMSSEHPIENTVCVFYPKEKDSNGLKMPIVGHLNEGTDYITHYGTSEKYHYSEFETFYNLYNENGGVLWVNN